MKKLSVGFIFLIVINFAFLQITCSAQEGSVSRVKVTKYSGPSDPSQGLPIKPTRTISFTTDEGTDMNIDISPDGSTILFDLLGDLYTIPIAGGKARQITRGIAINLQPIWSPDGKKIAYISDFSGSLHLNVRDLSGKSHLVLGNSEEQLNYYNNINPIWTPDCNSIEIDGTVFSLFGSKYPSHLNIIRFSKYGNFLYYLDSNRICRYDELNNIKSFISSSLPKFESSALSPDGRWWVYVTDSNNRKCLIAQDLSTNNSHILVSSLLLKYPFYKTSLHFYHYSFSPNSKNLYIAYGGKIHKIGLQSGENIIVPFVAHVKVDAGPLDYNIFHVSQSLVKVRYTRSASVSPDGRHLAFSALSRIYVMNLPNGKPHLLVDQSIGQFQPTYSPDGKWVAYVSWCDTLGGYLWRVPAVGGEPQNLTAKPGNYQRPAWSPDGTQIAVIKGAADLGKENVPMQGELDIMSAQGGLVHEVDDTVSLWNQLAFSPNGKRIIYQPRETPLDKNLIPLLVSRELDGSDLKILAVGRTSRNFKFLQQRILSPDGRFIVYTIGGNLYLTPTCSLRKPTIIFEQQQPESAIRFATGYDPSWDTSGKILSWTYGNKFFRVSPDKIISAAQKRKLSGLPDSNPINVNIAPDQVFTMNLEVPEFHANVNLALKDVRIITMHGYKVIEHGTVIIKNGRFSAVGPSSSIIIPRGTKILNLSGKTVIPGFVNLHLHFHIPSDIFPQQSWMFLVNFAFGVTTARDPSTTFDSFGYKELLESGRLIGPRLCTVGYPVISNPEIGVNFDNISALRNAAKKRSELGATFIKQYALPTRLQRQWLLIASRELGLSMTNEGDFIPLFSLAMMKDGSTGVEHNPEWGDVYKDVSSFIAGTGTYFTPTLQVRYGEEFSRVYSNYLYWHIPNSKLKRFMPENALQEIIGAQQPDTANSGFNYPAIIDAWISKQGGRVGIGSHGNNQGVGIHNELWALSLGGLNNFDALKSVTIVGANALGLQHDIGSIEVGKIADLIILNKNPLEDIHNSRDIRYVMKSGILYDGNTLDELWPNQTKCPEWQLKP